MLLRSGIRTECNIKYWSYLLNAAFKVKLNNAETLSSKKSTEFVSDGAETLSFKRFLWSSASEYDRNSTISPAGFWL